MGNDTSRIEEEFIKLKESSLADWKALITELEFSRREKYALEVECVE